AVELEQFVLGPAGPLDVAGGDVVGPQRLQRLLVLAAGRQQPLDHLVVGLALLGRLLGRRRRLAQKRQRHGQQQARPGDGPSSSAHRSFPPWKNRTFAFSGPLSFALQDVPPSGPCLPPPTGAWEPEPVVPGVRASIRPKIMRPAGVCNTLVTV